MTEVSRPARCLKRSPYVALSADTKTPMMLQGCFSAPCQALTVLPITVLCVLRDPLSCASSESPHWASPTHPSPLTQSIQHSQIRRISPKAMRCQKRMDFARWLRALQLPKIPEVHFMEWPQATTAERLACPMEPHRHREGLRFTDTLGSPLYSSPKHCLHVISQIKAFK